jgi:hypothetical protein
MADNLSSKMKGPSVATESAGKSGLPKNYGETKIVILPRDPIWFYAYWEVTRIRSIRCGGSLASRNSIPAAGRCACMT